MRKLYNKQFLPSSLAGVSKELTLLGNLALLTGYCAAKFLKGTLKVYAKKTLDLPHEINLKKINENEVSLKNH